MPDATCLQGLWKPVKGGGKSVSDVPFGSVVYGFRMFFVVVRCHKLVTDLLLGALSVCKSLVGTGLRPL